MSSTNNQLTPGIRTRCQSGLGSPLNAPKGRPTHKPPKRSKGINKHYSQKFGNSHQEEVFVNLNLGQYGFDSCTREDSLTKIEALLRAN
jgi:hypothetical protein